MVVSDEVFKLAPDLFDEFPLNSVMHDLVVRRPVRSISEKVALAVCNLKVAKNPHLAAGFWLYADDLEASHTISQVLTSASGSYLHGIMHRREGDFTNARYWFRQARNHPLIQSGELVPEDLVRMAEEGDVRGIVAQQREWDALMSYCLAHPDGD